MNNKFYLAWIILYLLICISCSNQNELFENSYKNGVIRSHNFKEVLIKIDSLTFSFEYYLSYDYLISENKVFFIGYNVKTHSLDYINLTDRQISKHIKLEKQGPNSIGQVNGINAISHDSILFADNLKFCIINEKGIIIWKLMKNDPRIFKDQPLARLNTKMASFKPGFNSKERNIILYYRPVEDKYLFKKPIIIEIGIDNLKTIMLPIYYPDYVKINRGDNPIYGGPRACFTNDKMILNFAFESNIFVYDYAKKTVSSYGGKSKYTPNLMPPIRKNTNPYDYSLSSLCFYKTVYDPYKKLYYRSHWGEMALKKSEFEFNTYYNKPVYLTVFDEAFNYIYETRLEIESGIVPEHLIPTPEGLMVFPYKQKIENLNNDQVAGILINFN